MKFGDLTIPENGPGVLQSSLQKKVRELSPLLRVAIEWLPRPHKNTPTEFYMKKKSQKAQNIAV